MQNRPAVLRSVTLVLTLLSSFSTAWSQTSQSSKTFLDQLNSSLKELADRVSPAVVSITRWSQGREDDQDPPGEGGTKGVVKARVDGAGVIVDANGYIVTNAHVVNGANRVQVTLNPARAADMPVRQYVDLPARTFDAEIVGIHQETDLAVLKIKATGLPALQFGNYEDLRQGQMVIAFGNPFGIRNAATIGIVSSVAVQVNPQSGTLYIQTDAALNPGDSGGALVDTAGRLVGLNTATLNADRVGLAIPSDTVKFVYEQLRQFGQVVTTDIGLEVQTVTPALADGLGLARRNGVIVSDVRDGLPADKAGIKPQDIIVSSDGHAVQSALQFTTLINQKKPGDRVSLQLLRGNQLISTAVPVVEKTAEPDPLTGAIAADTRLVKSLDIVAADIDSNVAEALPGIRQRSGVLVLGSEHPSEKSLIVGDIIHAVNGARVRSVTEIHQILSKLPAGSALVFQIERQKRFLYLTSEVH